MRAKIAHPSGVDTAEGGERGSESLTDYVGDLRSAAEGDLRVAELSKLHLRVAEDHVAADHAGGRAIRLCHRRAFDRPWHGSLEVAAHQLDVGVTDHRVEICDQV